MSNQELIDIAHRFKKYARGNSGFPDQHMRSLADHILATVREDDNEPLTVEWFVGLTGVVKSESGLIAEFEIGERRVTLIQHEEYAHHYSIIRHASDGEWVSLCGACITTRGQLRTLCRVFGVTLPEGGSE